MTETKDAMAWINCPACGEDRTRALFAKNGFAVVGCRTCGLSYVNPRPRPARLAAWYKSEYFGQAEGASGTPHLRHGDIKRATAELRLQTLRASISKGRLADIGCGGGFFVGAAAADGWDAVGLDPSIEAAGSAAREAGAKIVVGCLEASPFAGAQFDVVTMFDLLEHVFSPPACLAEARRLLAPGGRLLVETPNMAGWLPSLLGARHPYVRPPEHLTYFTPRTLRRILEQAGYRIERLQPSGRKILTLEYVLALSRRTNPLSTALIGGTLGRWEALRRYPVKVPVDTMLALATT